MSIDRASFGRLDLDMLAALVALVEERSTTAAAERLRLAQSTVSGILARLREAFGDELLVRTGNVLEPTPRALELVAALAPHLEGLSAALRSASRFDPAQDERVFTLGCTDAVALALVPALDDELRAHAPGCRLVVRVGDYRTLPGLLASGEIATALAFLREGAPGSCKVRVLRHSPWVVIRDRGAPAIDGLADFAARRHALVSPAGDLSGFVDDELAARGLARRVTTAVTSFALLGGLVAGRDLVATVPDFVGASLARIHPLAVDPCPVAIPHVTNTLAWRAVFDHDPGERWFRERIIALFSDRGRAAPAR